MTTRALALAAILVASPIAAQSPAAPTPDRFAWQWPLDLAGADGAARFTLTPEVYAQLGHADLRDLVAFNGRDESIPLGPAAEAFERLIPPPIPDPVAVPLFRIPRATATAAGDGISLHIARAPDGTLTRLDADVTPESRDVAQDLLLDLSALDVPVTGLTLSIDPAQAGTLSARVDLATSTDLADWRPLASGLAVVSLSEAGMRLERTDLDFAPTSHPYLRLRRSDQGAALPLAGARAIPLRSAEATRVLPERTVLELTGRAVAEQPGTFEYVVSGPFPVDAVSVRLADRNSVADVQVESRGQADAPWRGRLHSTAFRLGPEGDELESGRSSIAPVRDRQWRLRTSPAQVRAPTLRLEYRPEQFVLLTQSEAPYRLAAGSHDASRPAYPMRAVLGHLRQRHGDLWLPPEARLGAGGPLAGEAARSAPPAPPPYRQWALWGVLVAGVVIVIGMVAKLMRGAGESSNPTH